MLPGAKLGVPGVAALALGLGCASRPGRGVRWGGALLVFAALAAFSKSGGPGAVRHGPAGAVNG
jgi:hypothetical protein